jgi:hypothetical protein
MNLNLFDVAVLLTLIFIVLKILNKIDWSWLLVLSPIIIYTFLTLILYLVIFIFIRSIL